MRKIAAFVMTLVMIVCTACAAGNLANSTDAAIQIAEVEAKELLSPTRDQKTIGIAASASDFAFKLSAELAKNVGDESLVCSPISVWLPLAALTNAMSEQAASTVLSGLGLAGTSADELNKAASRMLYDLMQKRNEYSSEEAKQYAKEYGFEYHNPLAIANAVFVNRNLTLQQGFVQSFADFYRGTAINADFASPDAANAVNKWASDQTNGLIPEIVQGFEPETAAAIANAVYYSDRWDWEFDPAETVEDVFRAPGGDTKANFMLREGDMLPYYYDDRVQAMPLKLKLGGGMLILLPKDGNANGLLASMTNDYFQEIRNDSIRASGKLLLPRFKIDDGVMNLRPALEAMGFASLFEAGTSPLSGLIEEDMPVWLSGAVQKARIEVDEKGTTAAAVTIIPAPGALPLMPTEPFEMKCDRPFVFILYSAGEQVLFTGIVNRP